MEPGLLFNILISILSVISALLLYYSTSLQQLNSAQLQRLFDIKDDSLTFKGLKLPIVVLSIRFASVCIEILFFTALIHLFFKQGWRIKHAVIFLLIGIIIEVIGRFLLPSCLPIRERQRLTSFENSSFTVCSYMFLPSPASLKTMVQKVTLSKFQDHQFDTCDLSFRELTVIAESIFQRILRNYHSRIKYPGFDVESEGNTSEQDKTDITLPIHLEEDGSLPNRGSH